MVDVLVYGGFVLKISWSNERGDEKDRFITRFHTHHIVSHLTMITGIPFRSRTSKGTDVYANELCIGTCPAARRLSCGRSSRASYQTQQDDYGPVYINPLSVQVIEYRILMVSANSMTGSSSLR